MMTVPPPGFNANPVNRQNTQLLGAPGQPSAGNQTLGGAGSLPKVQALSPSPMNNQPNLAQMVKLLMGQK